MPLLALPRWRLTPLLLLLALAVLRPPPARAQDVSMDSVAVTSLDSGHAKITLSVTAGPSGAPGGFTVYWMKLSDYAANGGQWALGGSPSLKRAMFIGTPSLNTDGGTVYDFRLAPGQTITVEIGDLFDETGVMSDASSLAELEPGVAYIARGFANAVGQETQSGYCANVSDNTTTTVCTYTQGYWKTHPSVWPTLSLKLGTTTYTQSQLLAILGQPAQGNGLLSLAHQLIATKLNGIMGADLTSIAPTISTADALISSRVIPPVGGGTLPPSATADLTEKLDDYNNGITGPGHCGVVPVHTSTWGQIKNIYR